MRPSQGRDTGSIPVTRFSCKNAMFMVFLFKFIGPKRIPGHTDVREKNMKVIVTTFLLLIISISEVFASPLQWPMTNPQIVQGFGVTDFVKTHPEFYRYGEHLAVDLSEKFGAQIFSAADGVVIAKGRVSCPNYSYPDCNFGYGNWVLIWHKNLNIATLYQHLSELSRHGVGETVNIRDIIGYQGASGRVIGSHLHFAVFEGPIKVYDTNDGNVDFQILGREKVKHPLTLLPELGASNKNE